MNEPMNIPGALPSTPDYRDKKDQSLAMAVLAPFMWDTDLSAIPLFHQHSIGMCTGASLGTVIEWLYYRKTGKFVKLSRRFLYTITKAMIDQNTSEGSSMRNALKAAYNYGICTEETYPSETGTMTHAQYIDINAVPAAAFVEAKNYMIGGYVSIPTDQSSLSSAIYKYGMLYSRVECGPSWWQDANGVNSWDPARINPIKYPKTIVSGHAIVDKGYDTQSLTLRNTWGPDWCRGGEAERSITTYPPTEAWAVTLANLVNDLPEAGTFHHVFRIAMKKGDRSEEVKNLQIALMMSKDLEYVAPIDRGYYGALTQAAVFKYQLRTRIPMNWMEKNMYKGMFCGVKTLAQLNLDYK